MTAPGISGAPPHTSGRARTAVDALIVASSLLFVAWVLGLDGLYSASDATGRAVIVGVALLAVALASGTAVMATRARAAARPHLTLLACGLGLISLAACADAYLTLGGDAEAARVLLVGLPVGAVLAALAVRRSRGAGLREEVEPGLPTRASVFVPSMPFALGVLAAAYAGARGELDGAAIWMAAITIVLIVARQILALVENISFWRRLEAKVEARADELRRSESRFRSLVQNSTDAILLIAPDGSVRYASPSVRAVFGHSEDDLRGEGRLELIDPDDLDHVLGVAAELAGSRGGTAEIECRVRREDGKLRDVEAVARNLTEDPAVRGYVVNARDITERKTLERQLAHRAFHDPLTELANRALFGDRLKHALNRRGRSADTLAVLFLDLDDFKHVNDGLGHGAGDTLLAGVASRLLSCARPPDTVARLGGDEFAILLDDIDGALGSARVAERVLGALREPIDVGGTRVPVSASVGIATNSVVSDTAEKLITNADVAMYAAKSRGKGRFEHFEQGMHDALVERLALERDLRSALERGEFVLHYQPVVSLESGAVRAVEALARWQHPERGLLAPGHFVPLAESTGMVVDLGRWALREACRQGAEWHDRGDQVRMTVNVSPRQLLEPEFAEDVASALGASGLDPRDLLLEITESVIVEEDAAEAMLDRLWDMGVGIGIDDFGAKYSSLSYLRRLPIEVLKVDREFMDGVAQASMESDLLQSILGMARGMGLTPIVEGVETPEQETELRRIGCDLAQGYLFARPAPPEEIALLIESRAGGNRGARDGA